MKIGLQISSFTWPGGDAAIGETLTRICRAADDAGFDSIWVMDHLFQIRSVGEVEEPMLEGTTALGFMAGHTCIWLVGWAITKLALLASKPAITALYGWIWTMSHNQMCCCSSLQPVVARPS